MNHYLLKGITFYFIIAGTSAFAQDNTLPTTGNVGIGTLSPSARLDVNGNMKVDSCLHVKDSLLIEDNARIMSDMWVEGETRLDGDTKIEGDLYLPNLSFDNNVKDVLWIDVNGKTYKTSFDSLSAKMQQNIYEPEIPNDPLTQCQLVGYTDNPVWHNGPQKLFSECPEVNVGIATDQPRINLDVQGKAYAEKLFLFDADPINPPGDLFFHLQVPYTDNALDRRIFVVGNYNRKLFSLNNNGLLQAREIKIDALTWADFVFDEDYALMPLPEVEEYIAENGHLPNVPSEAEVVEEGINVAEMNALLLQKIEELTLHLIEQEKRINELENALSNE